MHFKFGFIHAYQDQENINVPIMFPWKEKLFVHIDIITKIFKILRVITLLSAVTRSELGDKMCILIRSIPAKKKKGIPEPAKSQWTPLSKFVIWISRNVSLLTLYGG